MRKIRLVKILDTVSLLLLLLSLKGKVIYLIYKINLRRIKHVPNSHEDHQFSVSASHWPALTHLRTAWIVYLADAFVFFTAARCACARVFSIRWRFTRWPNSSNWMPFCRWNFLWRKNIKWHLPHHSSESVSFFFFCFIASVNCALKYRGEKSITQITGSNLWPAIWRKETVSASMERNCSYRSSKVKMDSHYSIARASLFYLSFKW